MPTQNTTARAPPKASAGMDHSEEMVAELDEPPDEMNHTYRTSYFWSPPKFQPGHMAAPPQFNRRESLLTRQLHSETEHTDDEYHQPGRALSTQSTFSNPSTTSAAELTSDDGHSVASPAISPPLAPTHVTTLPIHEKPLDQRVRIVGQEGIPTSEPKEAGPEKTVEANLGRKRCITFACKGKQQEKPEPVTSPEPQKTVTPSPPKRKCMIKFACPTRSVSAEKVTEKPVKRPASPAPLARRPSADAKAQAFRTHRGSDSTVTHTSPKAVRKPSFHRSSSVRSVRENSQPRRPGATRKYSNDSESEGNEATRFHEFGTSEDEPEDWTRESTCHRSRLTLEDVLKKENVIRQACEEAEDEVVEEEEDEEDEADEELDEPSAEVADDGQDENDDLEEDEESDEGFHSDNEEGFASSDDDNDSDYEWWKPGPSTAATSVEHLDRLAIVNSKPAEQSSVGSASSGRESIRSLRHRIYKKHTKTPAMNINNRPPSPDLPDSTDFVCGTLDEDRPLEQAYINRRKMMEAAKHKARPQDIDPSFPTSDPEMDEEDDDDVDEVAESDEEEEHDLMHGGLDDIHVAAPLGRTTSNRGRGRSNSHRSPPPPKHISPPPPKRRSVVKSPPPPTKRGTARSPPPRKLFGRSPNRMRSPAPGVGKRMMTSPPNSPTNEAAPLSNAPHLGERPRLQHTASLPRGGGGLMLSRLATFRQQRHGSETNDADSDGAATAVEIPKRGAIDIVKGLEKKRRLRKEKMYQKMCAKQAAKGEKQYKVKPGKGCERMRELGLQIQEYKGGRAEHILSL